MTPLLYCLLYAGGFVVLAGCVVRAIRYAEAPVHLRWEIYPVPRGWPGELKIMVPEILFLKGLWEFNRPMWLVSYPFHLGLYLLSAAVVLLGCGVLVPAAAAPLHPVYAACGVAGGVLGLAGALGLLVRRITNRELRMYSSPADFFNLAWFVATFGLLLAGEWTRPAASPGPMDILKGAARFDATLRLPGLLAAGLASGAALLAYIPMTHMAHFIAKYFTYHRVRWDEHSTAPGGSIERRVAEYLMYRPTWSARHVGAAGRTWAEIAASNPTEGARK
jgi:nitrate reductase gamma subunit